MVQPKKDQILQKDFATIIKQEVRKIAPIQEKLPQKNRLKKPSVASKLVQNTCNKMQNNKFSVNDPNTPQFIQTLRRAFHAEIDLMQSRLIHEASLQPTHKDNDLMTAKIYIENKANISDHVFKFIRSELVGWIGVYQQQNKDTPIFHSLVNMKSYLTIICDNKYAFECVEHCVEDILQMKTIGSLKILLLPPITPMVYCVDAKYEGIASDSDLFLSQLSLHRTKLHSKNWVVVSHDVCPKEGRTYFMFLIDERSVMALNFLYSRSFYVCMQQLTFRYRSIVAEKICK